jgi:hypothetical protein
LLGSKPIIYVSLMTREQTGLVSFPPDGQRAAFLCARMIDSLAQSIDEIVAGCSSHVDLEKSSLCLSERIRSSSRVAPELYCIYFDLLQAVRRDDPEDCAQLLSEMALRIEESLPSFYGQWGTLPDSKARRCLAYVNVDPTTRVRFSALSLSSFDDARRLAEEAFEVLERVAPEISAEIRSLVTEIIFVAGAPDNPQDFDGATSFFSSGALFLNADAHKSIIAMIDGLTHESAHAHLFSLSLGEAFVSNPDDELHGSPLRRDPRPLDGTFHATYVSARMHYALHRVIKGGVLSRRQLSEARKALAASATAFCDGLETLINFASLTSLGHQVMDGARDYMMREGVQLNVGKNGFEDFYGSLPK